jgi:hypothetical protein
LSVLGLQDAPKEAIPKGLPKIEDIEDLFSEMADNREKVESTLRLVVDMDIVSDTDIRRTVFVFDWFIDNIVDPNFSWASFTRGAYISDKRLRAITKASKTTSAATSTSTAPVTSTIDFSTDVLTADAKRQTTPVTPRTKATLKPHLLWKSPFASATHNSSNIHQLHNTDIVLASSSPMGILECYRKLVAAYKPAEIEIDLVPIVAFDPAYAFWPHNRCADIIFEMNDAIALCLDQTGRLNLVDETIHILYQKRILDSSNGARAYAFLHALLKKEKHQLNDKMPTPPDIENATSIGSFGANLEWYYLQLQTNSCFFMSSLQQKGIEVDQFVDRLDNSLVADPLPEELTLTEIILQIKDICSFQPPSTAIINRYVQPTDGNESSHSRQSLQAQSSDLRSHRQPHYDSRPVSAFITRTGTQ